jgi:hypothetical protein
MVERYVPVFRQNVCDMAGLYTQSYGGAGWCRHNGHLDGREASEDLFDLLGPVAFAVISSVGFKAILYKRHLLEASVCHLSGYQLGSEALEAGCIGEQSLVRIESFLA